MMGTGNEGGPISLRPSNMYGHRTHCDPKVCDFLIGHTLVCVEYDDAHPMASRLEAAQANIVQAFADTSAALDFAARISSQQWPAFWKQASEVTLSQAPLAVFRIRYALDSECPIYDISWNPGFRSECVEVVSPNGVAETVTVDLPIADESISVRRDGGNGFSHLYTGRGSVLRTPARPLVLRGLDKGGWLVLTNCLSREIPVGTRLTEISKIRFALVPPFHHTMDLGKVASVDLVITEISLRKWEEPVPAIPVGWSAGIKLAGTGLELVVKALQDAPRNETLFLS